MMFEETSLKGAFVVDPDRREDERGFFARTWDRAEFEARGLNAELVQCSISFNREKGTLRGMHYQARPYEEAKLVRCTMGTVHDVIIDLRRNSPTFKRWLGFDLTADNRRMLYIPEGFAHGFLTLEDQTEIFYQMSQVYVPESAGGVRWDDPTIRIRWPAAVRVISDRDKNYPDFEPEGART